MEIDTIQFRKFLKQKDLKSDLMDEFIYDFDYWIKEYKKKLKKDKEADDFKYAQEAYRCHLRAC